MAKRGVIDHPKFARLKVKIKANKSTTLGYLETLWQFVGRYTPQGNVGKYSDEEIEAWLEWDGEEGALVAAFIACGWIDVDDEHRLLIHDWDDHVDHTTRTSLKRSNLEVFSARTVREQSENSVTDKCAPPEPEPVPEPVIPQGAIAPVPPGEKRKRFVKPTLEELTAYMAELELPPGFPEKFLNHYDRNGWKVGKQKTPMVDWRAACRTWKDMEAEREAERSVQARNGIHDPKHRRSVGGTYARLADG